VKSVQETRAEGKDLWRKIWLYTVGLTVYVEQQATAEMAKRSVAGAAAGYFPSPNNPLLGDRGLLSVDGSGLKLQSLWYSTPKTTSMCLGV